MPRQNNRRERGSSIVELGLIYGAFLFVVVGILDVGQVLFLHETHTSRLRAAARYGAVRPWNTTTKTQVQNMVLFGVPTGTGNTGYMGVKREKIAVTPINGSGGTLASLQVELSEFQYASLSAYIAGNRKGAPIRIVVPIETP